MSALISGDRRLSQAALQERAAKAAGGFRALGIGIGDVVALYMRNDFAFFEASLGAGLAGAYATPINWHFTAEETAYILQDSEAKVLVVHGDLWPRIAGIVPENVRVFIVPTPPEIAAAYGVADILPPEAAKLTQWEDWLLAQTPLREDTPPPRNAMIYTSGTTGRPKGVRRAAPTPEQAAGNIVAASTYFGLDPQEEKVILMNGPMYHSAPNSYGMMAARQGATIVLQPRFDAEDMLAMIERHRITHMHIVPTMFVRLLKLPEAVKRKYDLSSLRNVVHGAAPCPRDVKLAMIDWWGPVINEYYGSTETGIAVWLSAADALRKPGSVGRILPGCTVKAFGDDGRELPPGEIGELYIRAPYIPDFTYNKLDDKRREVARGELVTVGDVGYVDAEGFVYLCDRKRDMVISGGVNIYPAEIEAVLIGMPGVKDCAVFGIPDDEFGESLCAYIEPDDMAAAPSPDAVRSFLAQHVAKYKVPKIVEVVSSLPREDSGKIFKRKLRAPYWEKAGRSI
ncbi:acyl-CoA synthetase [uncultured Ferrovibrio sp.]|jgi:Acyl-CoA synthetases (AMP-forming)/AMP-acid ligases II|uniref:acyl-CoA synthetase n=1 Tax=uncultured Ferrovibrio sp. TaxID=1576913 RepID=UPI0026236CC5|nr:acyl-CoA synthetase [uncultured Ferrovibrio sp.]